MKLRERHSQIKNFCLSRLDRNLHNDGKREDDQQGGWFSYYQIGPLLYNTKCSTTNHTSVVLESMQNINGWTNGHHRKFLKKKSVLLIPSFCRQSYHGLAKKKRRKKSEHSISRSQKYLFIKSSIEWLRLGFSSHNIIFLQQYHPKE